MNKLVFSPRFNMFHFLVKKFHFKRYLNDFIVFLRTKSLTPFPKGQNKPHIFQFGEKVWGQSKKRRFLPIFRKKSVAIFLPLFVFAFRQHQITILWGGRCSSFENVVKTLVKRAKTRSRYVRQRVLHVKTRAFWVTGMYRALFCPVPE